MDPIKKYWNDFMSKELQLCNRKAPLWTVVAVGSGVIALAAYVVPKIPLPLWMVKQTTNMGYLTHPMEVVRLFQYKFGSAPTIPKDLPEESLWCYNKLKQTSRSFYAVILEIHAELRDPIMIFYLVLRALDSVEDDTKTDKDVRVKWLKEFHEHLDEDDFHITGGIGEKPEEIDLLEHFQNVVSVYKKLKEPYRDTIKEITRKMGGGMADFIEKSGVETLKEWDLYCHYVAGLVGHGLSSLFGASDLEDKKFGTQGLEAISNSMGLFLQKTNITRDYLEDILQPNPRVFYPKDVWSKYATQLTDLAKEENRDKAVQCLNELITNALAHVRDCLEYMKLLKEPSVFKFCAIPQVMAIATLSLCYNNPHVFMYTVKIRKGTTVDLIFRCTDFKSVVQVFKEYADDLAKRIPNTDPSAKATKQVLDDIRSACVEHLAH